MKILDIGCGTKKTPGAIGLDNNPRSMADVIHDLNRYPYPFETDTFDRILCWDILEHVNEFVPTVDEIWRILKPGGRLSVSAPFMSSVNYYSDPTHKRAFTSRSFDYFVEGTKAFEYRYSDARFSLESVVYDRDLPYRNPFNRWFLRLANKYKDRYESNYAFIFPVQQIYFELVAVKKASSE